MQDVIDSVDGAAGDILLGEIAFDEFHAGDVREILTLAGHQVVDDANAFAAADELFCQMGADETGAAGHEIVGHVSVVN
jgi:hypothetical protein